MMVDDRLTTLGALWAAWGEHGRTLTAQQWTRATRLGDWDVRSLYAHAAGWAFGFAGLVERVRPVGPTHDSAVALLREFNRPDGVARRAGERIAASAREDAATYSTAQMIGQFDDNGPRAIAAARELGNVVVDYFGHAMLRLDEVASIGIVEATVHLLDLRRALDLPPIVPPEALSHTAAVLAEMAPPVEFIELATGRQRGAERTAALFPVLS